MSMEALFNADELIDAFNRKGNELPGKLKELVSEISFIFQGEIMDEAPVKTHNLQSATRIDNINDFMSRIFVDLNIAPYAEGIITGTPPHEITPKHKKALAWPGMPTKYPVKKVMHPGTKANDYFSRGAENAKSLADEELENFKNWIME